MNGTNKVMKTIKVAFLGGGINSAVGSVHRIALEMDKKFELVSGCFSLDQKINESTANEYGIHHSRLYADLQTLLAQEKKNIDAIIILTPTPQHMSDVIACLKASIPVICEKALATSINEAREIRKTLEKTKGFLAVTYNYTGYPMLRELKNIIRHGKLGEIEQIHIEMPQEGFARLNKEGKPQKPQAWRLCDKTLPTISLDLGVHLHHLIHYLTNEKPLEVVAQQNRFGAFKQVVDNTICIANYTNDLVCNIWYSKSALGHRNGLRVRIYGDQGSAEWYQAAPEELLFYDNLGRQQIIDRANIDVEIANQGRYNRFKAGHPSGFIEAFANHYSDVANSLEAFLLSGEQPGSDHVFGIENATEGLLMLEAIAQSSKERSWIKIP